jgi:hypothetical protein
MPPAQRGHLPLRLVRFDGGLLASLERPPQPPRNGWLHPVDWLLVHWRRPGKHEAQVGRDWQTPAPEIQGLDDLFAQSQAAIAAIPGLDPPRYLRHFPAARKGLLSARLDQDSRRHPPFQEGLSDIVLQSVEFCGLRIAEELPELLLPPDDLAELEARLNALFAFTARAELDPALRTVSLDILQSLRAAVADYRIHGDA